MSKFDQIKKRTDALRHLNPQGYQEFVTHAIRDREWLVDYIEQRLNGGTFACPHCGKEQPHKHAVDRKGNADMGWDHNRCTPPRYGTPKP